MSNRTFKLLVAIVVASSMLALSAASVSAESQRAFVGSLTMTGDQEVTATCGPPEVCGDPDAVGQARIQIVPALDRVCFRLDWAGIDGTVWGGHIHGPATTAEAADVVVPLFMRTPADPTTHLAGDDAIAGCVTGAAADAVAANPSMYYVNVHSTVFPGGAIRAQLG